MLSTKNMATLYSSSLPEKQKTQLLDIYKEYIRLARVFEQIFKKRGTKNIALHQLDQITNAEDNPYFPWKLSDCNEEEKMYYKDLTSGIIGKLDYDCPNYCFVSLDNIKVKDEDRNTILGSPSNYKLIGKNNLLPNVVERFILTFKEDEKFEDLKYIIDGKYIASYIGEDEFDTVFDSLSDRRFVGNLSCLFSLVARLNDEKLSNLEQKYVSDIGFEALASEFSVPYEQVILGMQANLTEKTHNIIKEIYAKRYSESYMKKAQEDKLIRSASEFQDLINIRHLISHQLETLEGFGRFVNGEDNQNKSIRQRYLDSYNEIYDIKLIKRIDTYVEIANVFKSMVEGLNPNLFIRNNEESNSKFIARIKHYLKDNPNANILIEMNYPHTSEKKDALLKNIKKIIPNAEIIDDLTTFKQDEAFLDRIVAHNLRTRYLTTFQEIEREISEYCLYNGINCSPKDGWKILLKKGMLNKKEDKIFQNYRILRNALSHDIFDEELSKKLTETIENFGKDAKALEKKLELARPDSLMHYKDNIYKVIHKDGRVFYIDLIEKKAINLEQETKTKKTPKPYTPQGDYTEEYHNGCAIVLKGTKIQSIRTPEGLVLDLQKKSIILPDGNKIYLQTKEKNKLILGNYKIITDDNYKIVNFIQSGKSINISKNETLNLGKGQILKTNKNIQISELIIPTHTTKTVKISFNNDNGCSVSLSNGIKWQVDENIITHNNIELSYLKRKEFAESFNTPPQPFKNNTNER